MNLEQIKSPIFALPTFDQIFETDMRNPRDLNDHPDNPRGAISDEDIEIIQLSQSIKEHGILQPLVITPDGFVLAGHRRRRASIIINLDLVPCVIRTLRGGEFPEDFFLTENGQRENLSPLEEAKTIKRLKEKIEKKRRKEIGLVEMARRLNMNIHVLRQRWAILDLPAQVQEWFHKLEIPVSSSMQLTKLKAFPEECEKAAQKLVTRQITLKTLKTYVDSRVEDLRKTAGIAATADREENLQRIKRQFPENYHSPLVTRNSVIENLDKKLTYQLNLHTIKAVLDQTCCHCGLLGNDQVCNACPLPKFVNGLIGRSNPLGK